MRIEIRHCLTCPGINLAIFNTMLTPTCVPALTALQITSIDTPTSVPLPYQLKARRALSGAPHQPYTLLFLIPLPCTTPSTLSCPVASSLAQAASTLCALQTLHSPPLTLPPPPIPCTHLLIITLSSRSCLSSVHAALASSYPPFPPYPLYTHLPISELSSRSCLCVLQTLHPPPALTCPSASSPAAAASPLRQPASHCTAHGTQGPAQGRTS